MRKIGLPWTILRPTSFMENFCFPTVMEQVRRGSLMSPLLPNKTLQMIAVDDIGAFAAMALDNSNRFMHLALELAGDELTMPQVAAALSSKLGKNVEHVQVPMEEVRGRDRERAIMMEWQNQRGYAANIPAIREMRPQLLTFNAWLNKGCWSKAI